MNVLIACEESQRVCVEFRKLGHNAFSCDIQEPSGGHPEWHILGDVLGVLNPSSSGSIQFQTMDGKQHCIKGKWDLIIAHPPCTYLSNVAVRHHSLKVSSLEKINKRTENRVEAMSFFMSFVLADCDKIAIENPIGVMNTAYRKPDQIIQPYFFAESEEDKENYVTKSTCLWLKGLPLLTHKEIEKPDNKALFGTFPDGRARDWEAVTVGAKARSKTFTGIAKAIAEQWGGLAK